MEITRYHPVVNFHRGRRASSFFSPFGFIVAPSTAVSKQIHAERLVAELAKRQVAPQRVYEIDPHTHLMLKEIVPENAGLVFVEPQVRPEDLKAYVLPEKVGDSFFRPISPPREYYLDSITAHPRTAHLVRQIEIEDPQAARFVEEQLRAKRKEKHASVKVVYHNYRDEEDETLRLKADALVLLYKQRRGLFQWPTTYVFVHKLPGSIMKKLALEFVLEDHPPRVAASSAKVKLSPGLYGGVYQKVALGIEDMPLAAAKKIWPFEIQTEKMICLAAPRLSLKQKWNLFKETTRKDPVFGFTAKGALLGNAGRGLVEGSLLYAILSFAQDELKIAALLGVLIKLSLAWFLVGNNKAAAQVEQTEAKEKLGKVLDKMFPLYEMGEKYKTTQTLLGRFRKISLAYIASTAIYITLFPTVFNALFGAGTLSPVFFVAAYLAAEFMLVIAEAFESKNSFKIGENRLRKDESQKIFWTIDAFQDNIEVGFNQAALAAGLGGTYLVSVFAPFLAPAIGISLGVLAFSMALGRLSLSYFAREEKTRLEIKQTASVRRGKTLEFSENVSLTWEDVKVEIIEEDERGRIIIPDYEKSGVKLTYKGFQIIKRKKGWLGKLLPLSFLQKQSITVKGSGKNDPEITFISYDPGPYFEVDVLEEII